jgi:hypothetical protein
MLLVSLLLCIYAVTRVSAVTVRRFWLLASWDLAIEGSLLLLSSVDPADVNFLAFPPFSGILVSPLVRIKQYFLFLIQKFGRRSF